MALVESDVPNATSGRYISTPRPTRRWSGPPTSGHLRIRRAKRHITMTRLKSCPRQCPPERQSAWVTYLHGIAIAVALACAAPSIRAENRDTNGSVRYPHADQGAG